MTKEEWKEAWEGWLSLPGERREQFIRALRELADFLEVKGASADATEAGEVMEKETTTRCCAASNGVKGRIAEDLLKLHPAGSINHAGQRRPPRWTFTDQLCQRCGHPPCPHCGDWCDQCVHDEDGDMDLCCDGECSYVSPPKFFDAYGDPWTT